MFVSSVVHFVFIVFPLCLYCVHSVFVQTAMCSRNLFSSVSTLCFLSVLHCIRNMYCYPTCCLLVCVEYEGDSETLMQKKEADAMIADAFWGLEVYSVAFGVLCCLCIVCACHRRSVQAAEAEKAFGYAPYGGNHANGNGGFKRVFGQVDDHEEDPEMGRSLGNHSDEEERLYSQ